jgi:RNA ligase (TIGR02306 family)
MRTLATIQTIAELLPIENADAIELARVLGWHVVVKKSEFNVGDLCVYAEVDSVFPNTNPQFDFLQTCHWRIKTKKLRGVYSQGIVFSLDILPIDEKEIFVGRDVTEDLGIVKYDPPEVGANLGGEVVGSFPSFLHKTDETRVQVLQRLLTSNVGLKCMYTEKVDGTSSTFYVNNGVFGVCSRNMELREGDNAYWQIARQHDIENKLRATGKNIAIQGEILGSGIQGNKYKFKDGDRELFLFNIFDIDNDRYLGYQDFIITAAQLNIKTVPYCGSLVITDDIDALVQQSIGQSLLNKDTKREGIVIRPLNEMNDPYLGRISFKAINPEFLVKYDK